MLNNGWTNIPSGGGGNSGGDDELFSFVGKAALYTSPIWGAYAIYKLLSNNHKSDKTNMSILGMIPSMSELVLYGSVGLTVGALSEEALRYYYRKQAKERIEYFQIIPHAELDLDSDRINNLVYSFHQMNRTFIKRLTRGREWFQLYFICLPDDARPEGRIEIYFGFPRDRFSYVQKKILQAFPRCGLKRVHWSKVPQLSGKGLGGFIQYQDPKKGGFPLQEFKGKDQITGILEQLVPNSVFSVTFSPTTPKKLNRSIKKTRKSYYKRIGFDPKEMKKSDLDADQRHDIDQLDVRSKKNIAFDVILSVWQKEDDYGNIVQSVRDEVTSRIAGENNGFRLKRTLRNPIQIAPYSLGHFDFLKEWMSKLPYVPITKPMTWVSSEFANLIHLPEGMTSEQRAKKEKHLYNQIDHIMPGQSAIPNDQFNKGVHIGYLLDPVQEYRPIYLLEDVMRKMGVVIGKTGGGKTAFALMACLHVIHDRLKKKNGGLTIIDPKKDFAYTLLTYLNKLKIEGKLAEEQEQLFRFYDVMSKEYCFSINPMEKRKGMTEEEKMEIVNNTLEVLMSAYPHDSILFEKYGTVAIQALLEDPKQDHTILAISEFLDQESPLRDRLYNILKHGNTYQKGIAKDIERLKKGFGGTDTQTVYNRLLRLKKNPRIKRIFGQPKTSIKPLENMEKGIITLFNVEGLGENEMKLVMGYIAMEYHKASNLRKNKAQNHYLWIDEAHEVQLPVLWEKIIPKDRAMGLCLWLLTQSFDQFQDELLTALTDIGGNFISCIAGRDSAKKVQEITTGRVKATDVQNYRALTASVDTEDESGDRVTFMVKADPPYVWDKTGKPTYYGEDKQKRDDEKNAAYQNAWKKLGEKWMKRDCRDVDEVEKEIDAYMESLWNKKTKVNLEGSEEIKKTIQQANKGNVVNLNVKNPTPNQKVVGENPFSHLSTHDKEDGGE